MSDIDVKLIFRGEQEEFQKALEDYLNAKKVLIGYLHKEGFICGAGTKMSERTASGN